MDTLYGKWTRPGDFASRLGHLGHLGLVRLANSTLTVSMLS